MEHGFDLNVFARETSNLLIGSSTHMSDHVRVQGVLSVLIKINLISEFDLIPNDKKDKSHDGIAPSQ